MQTSFDIVQRFRLYFVNVGAIRAPLTLLAVGGVMWISRQKFFFARFATYP
jgi:hypothetical protein